MLTGKACYQYAYFFTKYSAEKSCSHDSLCKGVLDPKGDNGGFALCFVGPDYIDNPEKRIYDKRGKC